MLKTRAVNFDEEVGMVGVVGMLLLMLQNFTAETRQILGW